MDKITQTRRKTLKLNRHLPLLVALIIPMSMASADTQTDFKKFINGIKPKVVSAMKNKNLKFFDSISTDDFTFTDSDGKTTDRKTSMDQMKQQFGMTKSMSVTLKLANIKATDDTGVIDSINNYKITTKPGQDKKTHHMTMVTYERITWKKMGKTWKVSNITLYKKGKATMDGKPYDPSKAGNG
jgi:hypothetical protein